jgi:hypothetical protein
MAGPRSDDRSQARREAASLLGVDIDHLSAADGLRVDMISALRLVIDHEQAAVLDGAAADLGKLNVAVASLIALLPNRELPSSVSHREDPRAALLKLILEQRERDGVPDEGIGRDGEFAALKAEIEQLRAVAMAAGLAVPHAACAASSALGVRNRSAPPDIDIVPPGEIGDFHIGGPKPAPDDKPPPVTIDVDAIDIRQGFNDTPEPWRPFSHLYER